MSSIASVRLVASALALASLLATPAAAQETDRVVRELSFVGNKAIPDLTLANAISTTNSSWFARAIPFRWFGLGEKRYFSEQEFRVDVLRLQAFYRIAGYPDVEVDTTVRRTPLDVYITFRIREGEPIRLTSFQVMGLDSVPEWLRRLVVRDLPLEQGDVFNRFVMQVTEDSVIHRLRDRGYPEADVFREFASNRTSHTASLTLQVVPGRSARIGAVTVTGTHRVDSALVRHLLVARPGRRFSEGELVESQRTLYRSDLFRYASVGIDSAVYKRGSGSVPLAVQVAESPPRRIRGGLGFATSDCFRGSLGWTSRNFFGGGNMLDLAGRVSKVGVGRPLDWGFENGICSALAEDSGSSSLNFGVSAGIRRPGFLSPYNSIAVSLYDERRSEFKVYLRRETGVSFTFSREGARRQLPLSLAYTVSYGHTEATAANFCAFFNACTPDVLGALQQNRVLATLTGTATRPRMNNPINPTRGSLASLQITHSSKLIGSSKLQQFTRVIAEDAWYRGLARGVVLSWRVRGGVIIAPRLDLAAQSGTFIPPEHRFYAGGPNDVRGFERNELGPVVYVVPKTHVDNVGPDSISSDSVRVAATGGNTLGVANVELRFPSPIFSSRVRLATFIDAGSVWQRQAVSTPLFLRVTPGIGIRVETPLGPARLDIGYNPYSLQRGTLFQVNNVDNDPAFGALTPVPGRDSYVLDRKRNFTIHFAVGQPF
jgi:outer membrane protein assembly complex protein YaeT